MFPSSRSPRFSLASLLLGFAFALVAPLELGAFPAGQQTYHLLGNEEHILNAFEIIDGQEFSDAFLVNSPPSTATVIGISVPQSGQVIIYDHGEDGYEADYGAIPAAHVFPAGTTQIWGDGDPSNGVPPDDPGLDDVLTRQQAITLESSNLADASGCTGSLCTVVPINPRSTSDLRFDSSDVIFTVGQPLNVIQVFYPGDTTYEDRFDTTIGGSWEVFPVEAYEENLIYTIPVGVDTWNSTQGSLGASHIRDAGPYETFKHCFIEVTAARDDTVVSVDDNAGNVVDFVLDAGETWINASLATGCGGSGIYQCGAIDSNQSATRGLQINANATVTASRPVQVGFVTAGDAAFQTRFYNILPTGLYASEYVSPVFSGASLPNYSGADVFINNPNDFAITVDAEDSTGVTSINVPARSARSYADAAGAFVTNGSALRLTSDDLFWGVGAYDTGGNATRTSPDLDGTPYDWGWSLQATGFLGLEVVCAHGPGNVSLVNQAVTPQNTNGSPVWVAPFEDATTIQVDWNGDGTIDPSDIDNDGVADGVAFTRNSLQALTLFVPASLGGLDQTRAIIQGDAPFAAAWGYSNTNVTTTPGPGGDPANTNGIDWGFSVNPQDPRLLEPIIDMDKAVFPSSIAAGGIVTFTLVTSTGKLGPVTNQDIVDELPPYFAYLPGTATITYPDLSTVQLDPTTSGSPASGTTLVWDISQTMQTNETLSVVFQALSLHGSPSVTEDFETPSTPANPASYQGGTGWAGNWTETGDDGNAVAGNLYVLAPIGAVCLPGNFLGLIGAAGSPTVHRQVDLSGMSNPTLSLQRQEFGNGVILEASSDGVSYTVLRTYNTSDNSCVTDSFDLTPYASATTHIRFRAPSGGVLAVDELAISDNPSPPDSVTNEARVDAVYKGFDLVTRDEVDVYFHEIELTKEVSAIQSRVGDTLTYTLRYENIGSTPVSSAVVQDSVPAFTTLVPGSLSPGTGSYATGSKSVSWNLGTLNPGDSGTLSYQAQINTVPFDQTVIPNVAALLVGGVRTVETNEVETVVRTPIFEPVKSAPGAVGDGQDIPFSFEIRNSGEVEATTVVLTDRVPVGTAFVVGSASAPVSVSYSDDQAASFGYGPTAGADGTDPSVTHVRLALGSIPSASQTSATFTSRVTTGTTAGTVLRNFAVLTNDQTTVRTTNFTATVVSDLQLAIQAGPVPLCPQGRLDVDLTAINADSANPFTNVEAILPVPEYSTLVGGTTTAPAGWTIEFSTDDQASYSGSEPADPGTVTHVRFSRASMAAASSSLFELVLRADPVIPGATSLQLGGQIDSSETASFGPVSSNQLVLPVVNLRVSKARDRAAAKVGEDIVWTVQVQNIGTAPATGLVLREPANTGFNLLQDTTPVLPIPDSGSTADSDAVTWALGDLLPFQAVVTRTFTSTVNSGVATGTAVFNVAEVAGDQCSVFSPPVSVVVGDGDVVLGVNATTYGDQDDLVSYPLTLTNLSSSSSETYEITTSISDGDWAGSFQIYRDVDGDRVYDPTLDVLLTDSGGAATIDSGVVAPGQTIHLLVRLTIPSDALVADGEQNDLTVTATAQSSPSVTSAVTLTTIVNSATAVRLLDLRAVGSGGGVTVHWTTLVEEQNQGFWVARSHSPGGPWEPVHCCRIPGRGNHLGPLAYQQADPDAPASGPLWYRLTDVDASGRTRHHGPVAVDRDGDGLDQEEEARYGLDDRDPSDALADPDGDGLATLDEIALGRDPFRAGDPEPQPAPRFVVETTPPPPGLRVLERGEDEWLVELTLPEPQFEEREVGGVRYRYPSFPGVLTGDREEAGRPQLPLVGLRLPPGFTEYEIRELEEESLPGLPVGPAPGVRETDERSELLPRYFLDEAFYAAPPPRWPPEDVRLEAGSQHTRLVLHPCLVQSGAENLVVRRRMRVALRRGSLGLTAVPLVAAEEPGLEAVPPGDLYLLRVEGEGLVRLTATNLGDLGIPLAGVDPDHLALYRGGREIPIRVRNHLPQDGVLDGTDTLEFWARDESDRYLAGAGYFLLLGTGPGARWASGVTRGGAPDAPLATSYPETVRQEFREYYFSTIPGDESESRFVAGFGKQPSAPPGFSPSRVDFPLDLDDVAPGGDPGRVHFRVGASLDFPGTPDHRWSLLLDGIPLAQGSWDGAGFFDATASLPPALAGSGTHQFGLEVSLEGLPPEARFDQFLPAWLEVTYPRQPRARGDQVLYEAPADPHGIAFEGFQSRQVVPLDVTDPDAPVLLTDVTLSASAPYRATLAHDPARSRRIALVGDQAVLGVSRVTARPVSRRGLHGTQNRAGWLAVVPAGWESALDDLVALRSREGLEPMVVSMDEVADAFGAGLPHPEALRRLVRHARGNWERAPEYLVLGSDTHLNPRGHPGIFATAAPVHVPTRFTMSGGGQYQAETPDDGWFVRPAPGEAPELAVGRLPARSVAELGDMARKIVAYQAASGTWSREVLSINDDQEEVFPRLAEGGLAELLPGLEVQRFDAGDTTRFPTPATLATGLESALTSGALLVQFVGHGFFDFWTSDQVLDAARAQTLANGPRLPFVLSFTCYDNQFALVPEHALEGLGETLVRNPSGGAVAFYGAGMQSSALGKDLLHRAIMEALFREDLRRVGRAIQEGTTRFLANSSDPERLAIGFNLMGDPATLLVLPNPTRPGGLAAVRQGDGSVRLSWDPVTHPDPVVYQVSRRLGSAGATQIGTTTATEFVDPDSGAPGAVVSGQDRYYSVRARTSDGLGSPLTSEVRVAAQAATTVTPAPVGGGGGGGGCHASRRTPAGPGLLLWLGLACLGLIRRRSRRD